MISCENFVTLANNMMKVHIFNLSVLSLVVCKFICLTISVIMHCFFSFTEHIPTNNWLSSVVVNCTVNSTKTHLMFLI
jgi:hypothetical protein